MRALLLATALLMAGMNSCFAKPRVASINMCTDQLLLALADPEQIAGLSTFASAPAMSWYAAKAKGFRTLSGQAEDVLPLKPDLVLTVTFVKATTREMLRRNGLRVIELPPTSTVAEVIAQIRSVGEILEQSERAEAAIAEIEAAIVQTRLEVRSDRLRVLPLARRGWVSGQDTLINEMLERAGLANLGAETGKYGTRLSLEAIIALKPDKLLVGGAGGSAEDQGAALLQHPALARLVPESRRMILPSKMTVCAGPMLADAFRQMATEIRR